VVKAGKRRGGERGAMERNASGSVRWRVRCSGEKAGKRHGGDGERDARHSAVAGSRRCGEFFSLFSFSFSFSFSFRKLWLLEVGG
jgi:hypothetical protein